MPWWAVTGRGTALLNKLSFDWPSICLPPSVECSHNTSSIGSSRSRLQSNPSEYPAAIWYTRCRSWSIERCTKLPCWRPSRIAPAADPNSPICRACARRRSRPSSLVTSPPVEFAVTSCSINSVEEQFNLCVFDVGGLGSVEGTVQGVLKATAQRIGTDADATAAIRKGDKWPGSGLDKPTVEMSAVAPPESQGLTVWLSPQSQHHNPSYQACLGRFAPRNQNQTLVSKR